MLHNNGNKKYNDTQWINLTNIIIKEDRHTRKHTAWLYLSKVSKQANIVNTVRNQNSDYY